MHLPSSYLTILVMTIGDCVKGLAKLRVYSVNKKHTEPTCFRGEYLHGTRHYTYYDYTTFILEYQFTIVFKELC